MIIDFQRLSVLSNPTLMNRFQLLYGPGINDSFINNNIEFVSFNEALVSLLSKNGFEQIILVKPHEPFMIYRESSNIEQGNGAEKEDLSIKNNSHDMEFMTDGPLGTINLLPNTSRRINQQNHGTFGDIHAIRYLDEIMKSNACRSAVVIQQAETVINFYDDRKLFAGIVGSWKTLPGGNHNSVIFTFANDTYESFIKTISNIYIPEIRECINQPGNPDPNSKVNYIDSPGEDELERLFEYYESHSKLKITATNLEKIIYWMACEKRILNDWMIKLRLIHKIDYQSTIKNGWYQSVRNPDFEAETQLNTLVGLEEIKEKLKTLISWAESRAQLQNSKYEPPLMHFIFSGNPGTGKTTIARLLGEIMHHHGLLKKGHVVEVNVSDIISDHVGGTSIKTHEIINQALDGVLFIDEAYALTQKDRGGFGGEAIEALLLRMENDRNRFVVVAAGYPEKMREFLLSNPGLSRRFPQGNRINFPDYDSSSLYQILLQIFEQRGYVVEENTQIKLKEIIERICISKDLNFGNAGEMRNLADEIEQEYAKTFLKELNNNNGTNLIQIQHIPKKYKQLTHNSPENMDLNSALFDDLVGLNSVKQQFSGLFQAFRADQIRQSKTQISIESFPRLNFVFLGNPGTGKTTIARRIGKILSSMGLLRSGHVVETSRAGLVAGYVGQSEEKTIQQIKSALDGVLFIDEAYSLANKSAIDYGHEVINTLVKYMEDFRSRLCVIIAGYTEEMEEFLTDNPGLDSRFGIRINFEDFTDSEMLSFLEQLARNDGIIISDQAKEIVVKELCQQQISNPKHFGNARAVQNFYQQIKNEQATRLFKSFKSDAEISAMDKEAFYHILPQDVRFLSNRLSS